MRKIIVALLSMGLAGLLPPIAHAQFGSGIVFDPTQSGHAIIQIEHEEQSISNQMQQIENGQQIFSNTVKIAATALQTYNQIVQQYNLYHQMMVAPQMLYSRFLSPPPTSNASTGLKYLWQFCGLGQFRQYRLRRLASYQQVSVPHTNNVIPGYSTVSFAGQQQIAAQGATVDISDAVLSNNLQTLGTIRANQASRETDIANLETATQSQDPSQQTEMAALQRINQALLLQLRTMQDSNQINANIALQQIVAQKAQQDAMKSAFRDSSGYESYYNANIAPTSSGASSLLTQAY